MNKFLLLLAAAMPWGAVALAWWVNAPALRLSDVAFTWWIVTPWYIALVALFAYRAGRLDECERFDPDHLEAFLEEEGEVDEQRHDQ